MFITLKEVVGEKTVTLDGSIPPGKKIAVVEIMNNSMLCYSRKTLYHFDGQLVMGKKHVMLTEGHHMSKEIRDHELDPKDFEPESGLVGVSEINYCIEELKTEENLIDGEQSDILHTYLVSPATKCAEMMRFEPKRLRFKRLKNKAITKLTLKVTDQHGAIIGEGLTSTVTFQIV